MSTTPSESSKQASLGEVLAGKYLTFGLGAESYGIPVLRVREIIRLPEITPVPQMPPDFRGVVNLRGRIIPALDLRRRFGSAPDGLDERTCVVVVQAIAEDGVRQVGLVVDHVEEVTQIDPDEVEETPQFGVRLRAGLFFGMARVKGRVKTLLDIDQVIGMDAFPG